jgi:N-acetylglucosaminyl-diphospho-decaprenol L-rhamnosyltransferase
MQTGFGLRRFPEPITLIFEVLGLNRVWPGNAVNRRYRYLDGPLPYGRGSHGRDSDGGLGSDGVEAACQAAAGCQPAPQLVEQPPGAFLMFRREVWRKLGGMDREFRPIWFEDVDFCKRAWDAGYRARYVPEVVAMHRGGHSIKILNWRCREVYWYASLLRYASKHYRRPAFLGVSGAVLLSTVPRAVFGVFRWRSLQAITVYAQIAGLAARSMVSGRVQHLGCCTTGRLSGIGVRQ